jgi:hypothetical protein
MRGFIIFILLVTFSLSFAEKQISISSITLYSGISARFPFIPNETSTFLENYWHRGINFGVEAEIKISKNVLLCPTYELSYFKFDTYFFEGSVPELYLISYQVENSFIHRFLINLKFISSGYPVINPYFMTGIGYVYEDIGQVETKEGYMGYDEMEDVKIFDGKNCFVHSAGIGIRITISDPWFFQIESRYYSNYSDRFHYSINMGLSAKL